MPVTVEPLADASWWRVLGERLLRQGLQTAAPVMQQVVAAGGAVNVGVALAGLAGVEAVTLGKALLQALTDLHVNPESAWYWQAIDRAVPAAAGVLLGVQAASWADVLTVDWASAGKAALFAALLAQVTTYAMPARFTVASRRTRVA